MHLVTGSHSARISRFHSAPIPALTGDAGEEIACSHMLARSQTFCLAQAIRQLFALCIRPPVGRRYRAFAECEPIEAIGRGCAALQKVVRPWFPKTSVAL